MEVKTTIVYDLDKVIKNFEISGYFAQMFENFLLEYIALAEDKNTVLEAYKKIAAINNGDKEIKLNRFESFYYLLTAMAQSFRKLAIDQGVAKEIPLDEAAIDAAKDTASLYLEGVFDETKRDEFNKKYKETIEIFKKAISS